MLKCLLLISVFVFANTITVKNIEELKKANEQAEPGDIIILQNGTWFNVAISLDCKGTKEQPITFKAETEEKVLISGKSQLKLGGEFIIVDGLYFLNGYAGNDAVIEYRINKNTLANNCRVTNCVVNDFNNPKRMDENNWVLFFGKNNQLDHCSFINKKNMGVLLAVILDDDRSRENFHSIDHNYFGLRLPLASNGGEIIRVGVSQHCQFNSNTEISNNFFERCDGETEVISIKSCKNIVRGNVFKECQGSVVLRHGDNNEVLDNIFIGNDKPGTGGVRVINKGQLVKYNVFFKCRGANFRSPLAIMNGIPNSPANRYVQVTDAEITNNTFYECAPMSFCEGSDTERTLPPDHVIFEKNNFYNTRDKSIYTAADNTNGFLFANNKVSKEVKQALGDGFEKTTLPKQKPVTTKKDTERDMANVNRIPFLEKEAYKSSGAGWFSKIPMVSKSQPLTVNCSTVDQVYEQLGKKQDMTIKLTGKDYILTQPFSITKNIRFTSDKKTEVTIYTKKMLTAFLIAGKGKLTIEKLLINGSGVQAKHFIANDSLGSSEHYNLSIRNSAINALNRKNGCEDLFFAHKYMIADSIIITNSSFRDNDCNFFMMTEEKDNKGYYNAEKIYISQNTFNKVKGVLLNVYRGGNDESTLGPLLTFNNNKITDCGPGKDAPLVMLYGVQKTSIEKNSFTESNKDAILIKYEDLVRAAHLLRSNKMNQSGTVVTDKFVEVENNVGLP
jgi:poly(beta-D-mannuronate) lyase